MSAAVVNFTHEFNQQGLIEMVATYALDLSQNDLREIKKAGHGYSWSDFLLSLDVRVGKNPVPEKKAWDFYEAVNSDTENLSTAIPFAPTPLAEKIWSFLSSLV